MAYNYTNNLGETSMSSSGFDKDHPITTDAFNLVYKLAKEKNKEGLNNLSCIDVQSGYHTPISLLAKEADMDSVEFLLARGAKIDEAVRGAAIGGHTKQVEELLARGAKIDWAVYGAAFGGHTKQVEELLARGAKIDWAVYGAAFGGHTKQVEELLARGAKIDWAVSGAAYGGHLSETRALRFLSLMDNDKLRTSFAKKAESIFKFNIIDLLKQATQINKYMKEKNLNFDQALALTVPEVTGLINYQSESTFFPSDLTAVVASYLTPITQKDASTLIQTEESIVKKAMFEEEQIKAQKEHARLEKLWEKDRPRREQALKEREKERSKSSLWAQPSPEDVREKENQAHGKQHQKKR
jgi:esterase/lipase